MIVKNTVLKIENGIAYLELTQGQVALVSVEDLPLIAARKWRAHWEGHTWYVITNRLKGESGPCHIRLHRFLLNPGDGMFVDHQDRNGLNNTRDNLRLCTKQQNDANRRKLPGSSNYRGVYWDKGRKAWCAEITVNNKRIRLGYFRDESDAAMVYNDAALEHLGDFAQLNVSPSNAA